MVDFCALHPLRLSATVHTSCAVNCVSLRTQQLTGKCPNVLNFKGLWCPAEIISRLQVLIMIVSVMCYRCRFGSCRHGRTGERSCRSDATSDLWPAAWLAGWEGQCIQCLHGRSTDGRRRLENGAQVRRICQIFEHHVAALDEDISRTCSDLFGIFFHVDCLYLPGLLFFFLFFDLIVRIVFFWLAE